MRIFLLIFTILVISSAQVLGIDFGTEFWKASLISPGKNLVIVENSRSERKTINGISIQDGVRHFQIDALYKRLKKPHNSYFYLNKLLRSLDFQKPLQGFEFENGTYFITHEEDRISLEQLVAMILKNVKLHASDQAGSDIKDAVLTIPPSWGWKSKMALLNAAHIAELSVLGFVNENSAAAINFAITRNDTDPINIGFFNLGSHNLQFSIMQFFGYNDEAKSKNIESLRVLSHIVVQEIGGLQVDKAIADHLSQRFFQQHKLDPRKNKKSYTKLLHEATEAKETLSANKQTQVYVEGIMQGIDLNLPFSREVVQKLEVFQNLNKHLDDALQKAGITKSDLHSIELIGGGSRIPLVSKIVKQHFDGIQVGSHINGDEAMAFGASLRAANLSIAFRVKQLHFYDGFQKDIKCIVSSGQQILGEEILFTNNSQHGQKATIHLIPAENQIQVSLYYGEQVVKTYSSENITSWKNIYNETNYNFSAHPNLVLGFLLSTATIVDLKESYVNLTFNKTEVKTIDDWIEEQVNSDQSNFTHLGKENINEEIISEITKEKKEHMKQKTEQKIQDSQETSTNSTASIQNNTETSQNDTKIKYPKKKLVKITKKIQQHKIQTKKYPIKTSQIFTKYPEYNRQQIQESQKILQRFEKHENYLKQKSQIRNELESTLYKLKDSYEEPYLVKFSKQGELDNLKKVVSQKLQWLDENAWTAEKNDFQKQYNQVFDAYRPMYNRSNEYADREEKYNQTIQYLSFTYQKTLELNNTHSWLSDQVLDHLKKINQTVKEIHERLKKQYEQPLNEDPLLYVDLFYKKNHQMIKIAQRLRDEYYLLKMIPRPKFSKKSKSETKQETFKKKTNEYTEESQNQDQDDKEETQSEDSNQDSEQNEMENQDQQQKTKNKKTEQKQNEDL